MRHAAPFARPAAPAMSSAFALALLAVGGTFDAWDPNKHTRAKNGQFGSGSGTSTSKASTSKASTIPKPRAPRGTASVPDKTLKVKTSGTRTFSGQLHVVTKTTKTKVGATRTAVHGVYASKKAADTAHAKLVAKHGAGSAEVSTHGVAHAASVPTHVSVQSRLVKQDDGTRKRVVHGIAVDHMSIQDGKPAKTTRHAVDGARPRPKIGDRIASDLHGPGVVTKVSGIHVESDHGGTIVRRQLSKVAPKVAPVTVPKPSVRLPKATPLVVAPVPHAGKTAPATKPAAQAKATIPAKAALPKKTGLVGRIRNAITRGRSSTKDAAPLVMSSAFAQAILSVAGTMDAWDEAKHKRARDGRFGSGAPRAKKVADDKDGRVHVVTRSTKLANGGTRTSVHGVFASQAEAEKAHAAIVRKHGAHAAQMSSHAFDGDHRHLSIQTRKVRGKGGVSVRKVVGIGATHVGLHGTTPGVRTSRHAVKGRDPGITGVYKGVTIAKPTAEKATPVKASVGTFTPPQPKVPVVKDVEEPKRIGLKIRKSSSGIMTIDPVGVEDDFRKTFPSAKRSQFGPGYYIKGKTAEARVNAWAEKYTDQIAQQASKDKAAYKEKADSAAASRASAKAAFDHEITNGKGLTDRIRADTPKNMKIRSGPAEAVVEFPYNEKAVSVVRSLPGASYDKWGKSWTLTASSLADIDRIHAGLHEMGGHLQVAKDARKAVEDHQAAEDAKVGRRTMTTKRGKFDKGLVFEHEGEHRVVEDVGRPWYLDSAEEGHAYNPRLWDKEVHEVTSRKATAAEVAAHVAKHGPVENMRRIENDA